jgi:hypothetical protein
MRDESARIAPGTPQQGEIDPRRRIQRLQKP